MLVYKNGEYYAYRAAEERARSLAAGSKRIGAAHRFLAEHYEKLALEAANAQPGNLTLH